jgi:hypothetical protein
MSMKSKAPKKQTRLQFAPLSSSSPAKERYSDAVEDSLATARHDYVGHHQTSRGINDERGATALPTPEKSSQPAIVIKDGTMSRTECPEFSLTWLPRIPSFLAS